MRLLIVEDDRRIAESLKVILTHYGISVDLADTKNEGYDKALNEDYDLAIIDWMLPDGQGVDLCKEIRSENVQYPILMLTAKSMVDDITLGLDAGADDYLTKPFDTKELLARVRALSRRKQQFVPDIFELDSLSINYATREVFRNNTKIDLSPKEYGMLEYLAKNSNKAVAREELLGHVWDENADSFTNTVDVHIRYLRRKIDDGYDNKLIHTIKGKGYRLCRN